MADEVVDTRLARVEEKVAAHEQRLNANDERINTLTPLVAEVATLTERQTATHTSVRELSSEFSAYRKDQADARAAEADDRKQLNRWAIGLAVTILLALISYAIFLAAAHP